MKGTMHFFIRVNGDTAHNNPNEIITSSFNRRCFGKVRPYVQDMRSGGGPAAAAPKPYKNFKNDKKSDV